MLFFEVPQGFERFQIYGVRVRRISRYRSQDTKSMLNISEVRELQMFDVPGDDCIIWKAVGSTEPYTSIIDPFQGQKYNMLFLWHEVGISCPEADEMFDENKKIELGEEASWNPRKLAEINALQSLYRPACEMLKQMDGVGFYNDNEIDAEAVLRAAAGSQREAEKKAYYFW